MIKEQGFEHLMEMLAPFFASHHYSYLPVENQFRLLEGESWRNIILGSSTYEDGTVIELSFGVRNHWAEETIAPYVRGMGGFHAESNTAVVNWIKYHGAGAQRFWLRRPGDAERVAAMVRDFFSAEGFAFLAEIARPAVAEKLFNTDFSKASLLCFHPQMRAFRGMALASQVQSPAWESHHAAYRAWLQRYGTPIIMRDRYEVMVEQLRVMAPY